MGLHHLLVSPCGGWCLLPAQNCETSIISRCKQSLAWYQVRSHCENLSRVPSQALDQLANMLSGGQQLLLAHA